MAIARAGIDHASTYRLVLDAFADVALLQRLGAAPLHVVAAGKAARSMASACVAVPGLTVATALAVGSHESGELAPGIDFLRAGHPIPDERSVEAARRVLDVARRVGRDEYLLVLLSGGASALVAAPLEGITLADKQRVIRVMMHAGADIHALNTVRKHLSAIKGGRLAAACRGQTLTLAVSDVVGDDPSVIGSGPGVPDPSTWHDALLLVERWGGGDEPVLALLRRGARGEIPETPKAGDHEIERAEARVIGGRQDAVEGARRAAEARGYHVVVMPESVTGEARDAARAWLHQAMESLGAPRPACVLSAGETTVRVTGDGMGGRNQEFALALVSDLDASGSTAAAASVGTDGVDGPTDAAGAIVDSTSGARAAALNLGPPERYLERNDSYTFFHALGDLIHTGPTDTNVGDLQVLLVR